MHENIRLRRQDDSSAASSTDDTESGRQLSQSAFMKISETLGALNTFGRYIVNMTRGQDSTVPAPTVPENKDESIPNAILTLTKNVLGENAEKTIEPLIKRVGASEAEKTPKEVKNKKKDEKIQKQDMEPSASSKVEEIQEKDGQNRCRTPAGGPGRCDDLSNCPALLLNLVGLRDSLCFKSLFVPGVCCPISDNSVVLTTQRPTKLKPRPPAQSLILRPQNPVTTTTTTTTRRPLVPVYTIPNNPDVDSNGLDSGNDLGHLIDPEGNFSFTNIYYLILLKLLLK